MCLRVRLQKPKYNVIIIASDDLRPSLGCYGDKIVKTPNIDKLASRGISFDRAFTQYPLCNPSRSSLLTGRYPTQTGVMDNELYFRALHPEFVSLPQYFKANGYVTLRAGKIFHGGIDDTDAWTEGGERADSQARNVLPQTPTARNVSRTPIASSFSTVKARIVKTIARPRAQLSFSKNTRTSRSFWRLVRPSLTVRLQLQRRFFDLYDVNKIPLPPDFSERPVAPPGFPEISIARRNTDLFIGRDASPEAAREMIRAYYASVSFMDEQIGRVLDALDRLKLRNNTIVVFWGDHGYHLGEKGKWSKAYSLFEIATRVPLIIATPETKRGSHRARSNCWTLSDTRRALRIERSVPARGKARRP